MDRVISLLAALVGLIALGGAILVHVNADTQHTQMAAEIAQLKAAVGADASVPAQVAEAEVPQARIPSAEHLTPSSSEAPAASAAAAPSSSTPVAPLVASASEPPVPSSDAAPSSVPPTAPPADVAAQLAAMQSRIAELEQTNKDQASQLAATQAQLATRASSAPAMASSGDIAVATADATAPDGGPAVHADPTVPAKVLAPDGPTKDCIPLGTRFMGAAGDSFPLCRTRMVLKVGAVTDGMASVTGAGDVVAGATVPYGNGCLLAVFSADTTGYAEMRVSCQ